MPNLYSVVLATRSPGRKTVHGKVGWFGEFRKVLRFKAKTRVAAINLTGRPAQRSIQMVAAVKLKCWLRGVHFENTSAARIARAGGEP